MCGVQMQLISITVCIPKIYLADYFILLSQSPVDKIKSINLLKHWLQSSEEQRLNFSQASNPSKIFYCRDVIYK